jgi:Rad9.
MDVIIPAHNIKTLSNAVQALAKIGKFLYVEFDPLTGLTLRTLNDAKSSFAEFTFDVGFFERCSSGGIFTTGYDNGDVVPGGILHCQARTKRKTPASTSSSSSRKQSKNLKTNSNKNDDLLVQQRSNRRLASSSATRRQQQRQQQQQQEEEDCEKYLCRVPIRTIASLLHSRKGLLSLRIRSITPSPDLSLTADTSSVTSSSVFSRRSDSSLSCKMQLSFEFRIQSSPSSGSGGSGGQGIMFVTHRIFVSSSPSVVATASRTNCSEIVVDPVLWMKLMDPVQSPEMALIVSEKDRRVTASSFHYADGGGGGGGDDPEGSSNRNLVLSAMASRVLKTETSVHCDDLDEFVYSDGGIRHLTENDNADDDDGHERGDNAGEIPEGIEDQVVLVFSSREAKAMAQFCVQQAGGKVEEFGELKLIVNFYWGGKPIVFETEGDAFQGVLILSTVHHSLLKGVVDWTTTKKRSKSDGARKISRGRREELGLL